MGCHSQPINYILFNFLYIINLKYYIINVITEDITPATNKENVPKENSKFILLL